MVKEINSLPVSEKEELKKTLKEFYDFESERLNKMSERELDGVEVIDLYKITKRFTTNEDIPFIKSAIKKAFIEASINNKAIKLKERNSNIRELKPIDIYVNSYAETLLDMWYE